MLHLGQTALPTDRTAPSHTHKVALRHQVNKMSSLVQVLPHPSQLALTYICVLHIRMSGASQQHQYTHLSGYAIMGTCQSSFQYAGFFNSSPPQRENTPPKQESRPSYSRGRPASPGWSCHHAVMPSCFCLLSRASYCCSAFCALLVLPSLTPICVYCLRVQPACVRSVSMRGTFSCCLSQYIF